MRAAVLLGMTAWVAALPPVAHASDGGEWIGPRFSSAIVLGLGLRYIHGAEQPVRYGGHVAYALFPLWITVSGDSFREAKALHHSGQLKSTMVQTEVKGAFETDFRGGRWVRAALGGGVALLEFWDTSCQNRTADLGSATLRLGVTADSATGWSGASTDVVAAYSRGAAFPWPAGLRYGDSKLPYGEYGLGVALNGGDVSPMVEARAITSFAPFYGFGCNE